MYGFNDKGEVCPRISLITFVAIPDSSKLDARLCRNKRTYYVFITIEQPKLIRNIRV